MGNFINQLPFWIMQIVYAVAIYIVGKWLAKMVTSFIKKLMVKADVDETLVKFVGNLTYIGLLAFVIIAALGKLGIQTASFVAVIGAAGLAVGLALQGSLSNFAAGVMIILFRPFKAGDFVEAGGTTGSVREIQIFNTILMTPDNKKIILPNATITSGKIVNFSSEPTRRVDFVFGIGYGDDIAKAKRLISDLISADARILKDPEAVVVVGELAESSVNLIVRVHVNSPDYWGVFFDLTEKVKLRFDEEGVSIPFPQRDLHVYNEK